MSGLPKTTYYVGEKLDLTNFKLKLLKNNGSSEIIDDYVSEPQNGFELNEVGKQTVKIKSNGIEYSFDIFVYNKKLVDVFIKKIPNKISYYEGDLLSLDGLQLVASFSDGSTEIIENYEVFPELYKEVNCNLDSVKLGFLDKYVDLDITVYKNLIEFIKEPENQEFEIYTKQNLETSFYVNGSGKLKYSLYNYSDESLENPLFESDTIEINGVKVFNNFYELPKRNTVKDNFKFVITLTNGSIVETIESKRIVVNQKLCSEIPTLFINTEDGKDILNKIDYIKSSVEIVEDNNKSLIIDNVSIKGRGNTSWSKFEKKPYALKLDKKNSLLGMKESKKWVLIANHSDKSLLRNYFVSYIGNNIFTNMSWNPSFKLVDLILNGEYKGCYILGESVKIEKNRVNIQSIADTFNHKGSDLNNDDIVDFKDGGFLLEINKRLDENFNFTTTQGVCISLKDPDTDDFIDGSTELDDEVGNYIKGIVQNFEDVLYSSNWLDENEGYKKYIDIDSFIDWYLVNEFTANNDSIGFFSSSYFYYNPSDMKIYMGPDWDYDIAMGNYKDKNENYKRFYRVSWFSRMFKDPYFANKVKDRWNSIKNNMYESIDFDLQDMADFVSVSAEYNFNRWPILGTEVWPNVAGYERRKTYQSEVNYLRSWMTSRYYWFDTNINKK